VGIGPFGIQSFVFEIDNEGRVSGFYDVTLSSPGSLGERHAFVWTKSGGKVDLPTLGGTFASSGDINSKGQMTGRASDASGVVHAVIWDVGKGKKD
jgi:uncharacterized membrane protein